MRRVPESQATQDWPRKVAQSISSIITAVTGLQAKTDYANLPDHADDAAAATGGVGIGEPYRTGSTLKVRIS